MAKVKTNELIGSALDWAVVMCEGLNPIFTRHYVTPSHASDPKRVCIPASSWVQPFEPSTNWAQGGPIIERECITSLHDRTFYFNEPWRCALSIDPYNLFEGETILIAAMRCYVASKLGEFVNVPEELL